MDKKGNTPTYSALQKGIGLVTQATEEDTKKNYREALRLYEEGVEYFVHSVKYEAVSDKSKSSIRNKCEQYLKRADTIQKFLQKKDERTDFSTVVDYDSDESEGKVLEKKLLRASSVVGAPSVGLKDVIGLESAKNTLEEAFVIPERFPQMFKGTRKPYYSVLIYGPPGTGKSLLTQLVATAATATVFNISIPYVVSHWTGETDNMVEELFSQAWRTKPSIICLEELDVLTESDRLKTEFLSHIDRQKHESCVRILATSSQPWKLDTLLFARFEKTISINLPDSKARVEMFQHFIGDTPHSISGEEFVEFAERTKGYSGGDISRVVREAVMTPVRVVQGATHFRKVRGPSPADPNIMEDDLLTPCSPGAPGAIELSWSDVPGDKLLEPAVSKAHILTSLAETKPSTDEDRLKLYERFTVDMG